MDKGERGVPRPHTGANATEMSRLPSVVSCRWRSDGD